MEEFVAYIIKNLVSVPDSVEVKSVQQEESLKIEVRVAGEDVGKIIGRKGNTINALRTIVRTVATRLGKKVHVDLIQPDREEQQIVSSEEATSEPAPEAEAAEEAPVEEVVDAPAEEEEAELVAQD